eukprot:CAMPEP_0194257790 /NCGR_PEP_ID=MMETSP0158-20130606/39898_1 /TAXON_ID=33649 /ORGANISM="Thalassionema nitzschioides, Strain L26-B" /LENGTH=152 /DNA_ID=CAMNT_0038996959 /DNA_START=163 /DNA_END=617 /DNA_ORIENTATION=+
MVVLGQTPRWQYWDEDDFGGLDSEWLEIPGVINASVGYTGNVKATTTTTSSTPPLPPPTYQSVCDGDGHTEAVRIEFDPSILSYEQLLRHFLENPRVPTDIFYQQEPQYQIAIWTTTSEQRDVALRVCYEVGKTTIPILDNTPWYDAESNHQ